MEKTHLAVFATIFVVCFLAFLPVSVVAVTTTIQPSSQDSLIVGDPGAFSLNFGGVDFLDVMASKYPIRTLVQFDLSSIPLGSTISSATLKLYYYSFLGTDPVGRTYWAYRVTQSWAEGGVTWPTYDGTNSWATGGGDYVTTGGASTLVPGSFGWMSWTVTDIVKAWVEDGFPNCGFLIKDDTEMELLLGYRSLYYSREVVETPKRPILEVTYTPPTGIHEFDLSIPVVTSLATVIYIAIRKRLGKNLE